MDIGYNEVRRVVGGQPEPLNVIDRQQQQRPVWVHGDRFEFVELVHSAKDVEAVVSMPSTQRVHDLEPEIGRHDDLPPALGPLPRGSSDPRFHRLATHEGDSDRSVHHDRWKATHNSDPGLGSSRSRSNRTDVAASGSPGFGGYLTDISAAKVSSRSSAASLRFMRSPSIEPIRRPSSTETRYASGLWSRSMRIRSPAEAASRISPRRLRMSIAVTVLMVGHDSMP